MKDLWERVSTLGLKPSMTVPVARAVLLSNRLALILLVLSVILSIVAYMSLARSQAGTAILLSAFFYLFVLFLNYKGHHGTSRLLLSAFVPVINLAIAIYLKQRVGLIDELQYANSRVILLLSAIIPLTLFLLQERRQLLLGLSFSFLGLLFYDRLHEALGVGYFQLGFASGVYNFMDSLFIILYILLTSAFLYYKMMLEKTEANLMRGNEQLSNLYSELGQRHEEIQVQTDMLLESQQKLQEANQLIEQQRALLHAENIELHKHLLEKNKILEASNQELHSRVEELRQFSYTISHNLRGPVASLLGLANIFDLKNAIPHNRELLLHTKTATKALDTVICDLSKVLQIREGKLAMEPVELPLLLDNVLLSLKKEQEACAAEIRQDLQVVELQGVKSYLHSIFYNLISNAIKYHHPNRACQITIRSCPQQEGVLLEISDNGLGIDLERHGANLFKMYKRFHENHEGRGLGLYLIKVQTEILGGFVKVHSTPGEGTTFSLWLPQHTTPPLAAH